MRTRYPHDCPNFWDGYHYYADEDTGDYRPFCSCGHPDPYAPREDDEPWPMLTGPINPPF